MKEKSDKKGYKFKRICPNNDVVYHNGLKLTEDQKESLNRIFSEAWDNLTIEQQIEINNRIKEKRMKEGEK